MQVRFIGSIGSALVVVLGPVCVLTADKDVDLTVILDTFGARTCTFSCFGSAFISCTYPFRSALNHCFYALSDEK